jgi:hypothetical protein
MIHSGTILTKKRHSNSPNHTFGDIYINDKVFTVKKSIYDAYQIGDKVEYSFTDHVSFSGVLFHNLNHMNKTGYNTMIPDSKVISAKVNQQEIEFYVAQASKFFFWIKMAFVSFIFFFVEMYFLARFNLDTQLQSFFGAKFFLPIIFLVFFVLNFIVFTPLLRQRKFQKLKSLEKTILQFPVIEFIQEYDSDVCVLSYLDNGQIQHLVITMDNFHQIKRHQLVEITFLNHHCLYNIVGI